MDRFDRTSATQIKIITFHVKQDALKQNYKCKYYSILFYKRFYDILLYGVYEIYPIYQIVHDCNLTCQGHQIITVMWSTKLIHDLLYIIHNKYEFMSWLWYKVKNCLRWWYHMLLFDFYALYGWYNNTFMTMVKFDISYFG